MQARIQSAVLARRARFRRAQHIKEIVDDPIRSRGLEQVRRGAVLPNGEADGFQRIFLVDRLGKQTGKVAAQHVPRAALRQARVPRAIHEQLRRFALRSCFPSNQRLVAFEHDSAIAIPMR